MMEAEVSSQIGAEKHEQSQERTSHRCTFRTRRLDTRLVTVYLMENSEDWSVTKTYLSEDSLHSLDYQAA